METKQVQTLNIFEIETMTLIIGNIGQKGTFDHLIGDHLKEYKQFVGKIEQILIFIMLDGTNKLLF